ncbi:MAG TPA: hypothetical protein VKR99_08320 [Candidatus Eremiobacteraceae bacterium]|nr:hypothetical protein [Candidatus Eremiobacteraceae bacterium]
METVRMFQQAVALRSLGLIVVAAAALAIFGNLKVPALALFGGGVVGVAYLFHIAASFNRLAKSGKRYLPFLTLESLVRVLLAGSLPFLILRHGPALGYFTYLAGFVAPLGVAILTYRKQIQASYAPATAVTTPATKTSA